MNHLDETNIITNLLQIIPEIRILYEDELKWWDDELPGLHNIFGNVGDLYAYQFNTDIAKERGIWGKYIVFQKVGIYHNNYFIQKRVINATIKVGILYG